MDRSSMILGGGDGLGLHDGVNPSSNYFGDIWTLENNIWTWIGGSATPSVSGNFVGQGIPSPDNYPPSVRYPAVTVDEDGTWWMFGGEFNEYRNSLISFSFPPPAATEPDPTEPAPTEPKKKTNKKSKKKKKSKSKKSKGSKPKKSKKSKKSQVEKSKKGKKETKENSQVEKPKKSGKKGAKGKKGKKGNKYDLKMSTEERTHSIGVPFLVVGAIVGVGLTVLGILGIGHLRHSGERQPLLSN